MFITTLLWTVMESMEEEGANKTCLNMCDIRLRGQANYFIIF